jgi:murein DD-endopeptidase MepM/ murein hydrolase activator NlpD
MSWSEAQARIGEIQTRLLGLVAPAPTPASSDRTAPAESGTPAASAVAFARVLDAALGDTPGDTVAGGGWTSPLAGRVTSGFGPRWGRQHNGVDIAAVSGTPVHAAAGGVVRTASWHGGYGNAVIIDHGDGTSTLYGHNSKLTVHPGDRVEAGQIISLAGSTGHSTGPHLHFEVRRHDRAVDPQRWLREHGVDL